jgi:hypothetical protein
MQSSIRAFKNYIEDNLMLFGSKSVLLSVLTTSQANKNFQKNPKKSKIIKIIKPASHYLYIIINEI